jgi:hypothetical protein
MRAEGPGQHHAVDTVRAALVHQEPRARVERGFRQLDRADIALRDEDARPALAAAVMQQVGMVRPVGSQRGVPVASACR